MPIKRTDHAEGRRTVADGAIDLLTFVEMGQEVVAVAFEIVADKIAVVAVSDEPHAFGKERILDLDFFETDRSGFSRDLGQTGNFIDQFALAHPPQCERELGAERQTVENRAEREADQCCGEGSTENDDERMFADEHVQIAAHQDHEGNDANAAQQA